MEGLDRSDKIVLSLIAVLVLITLASTAWLFLIQKNYPFIVEAPCDPGAETCFTRDCDSEEGCPVNGLSEYKMYEIRASDFPACSDGTCIEACTTGRISCETLMCGDSEEDSCSAAS